MGMAIRQLLALAVAAMALAWPAAVSGQQPSGTAVSCTASLITSFAPCFNFVTNGSASPTADCCRSLGALVKASTGCACLILTGSVPLGVPINRTLAVTLPRACNSASVPLQCRDASAESPAPGPIADAPATSTPLSLPPATMPTTTPETEAPAPAPPVEPTATPPISQGQTKPMVVPSSAWRASSCASATAGFLLLAAVGAVLM